MEKVCDMNNSECELNDCIEKYKKTKYKQRRKFYHKKRYEDAKNKNLCVDCLEKEATHGVRCYVCLLRYREYQREYRKKRYKEAKEKGICVCCYKNPATRGTVCQNCYSKKYKGVSG